MSKVKTWWKYFRLSMLFALVVFFIILATMFVVIFVTVLLCHYQVLDSRDVERFPLFSFCLISVVIGTVMAFVFGRMPLRPIRQLMEATDRIAEGDYSVRLDLRRPEEFRTLSEKFNDMAAELSSVELLRNDFVNNFSHEFKTPIASIRGFARALKSENLSEEEREEYLDIILKESERLADLSTNVLYLSKIEQQAILTNQKGFNLTEQIRLVLILLNRKLEEKHLELVFDCPEYYITGNEEMLKQVWINLLDNGIKFSPEEGTLEIRIRDRGDELSVILTDQGEGMSQNTRAHLFDKFYQGDSSHATSGNGLGLSIVKKIVDLHNGTIVVRSSDKGSSFEVVLPKGESVNKVH